jgi:hypothetical protein
LLALLLTTFFRFRILNKVPFENVPFLLRLQVKGINQEEIGFKGNTKKGINGEIHCLYNYKNLPQREEKRNSIARPSIIQISNLIEIGSL